MPKPKAPPPIGSNDADLWGGVAITIAHVLVKNDNVGRPITSMLHTGYGVEYRVRVRLVGKDPEGRSIISFFVGLGMTDIIAINQQRMTQMMRQSFGAYAQIMPVPVGQIVHETYYVVAAATK